LTNGNVNSRQRAMLLAVYGHFGPKTLQHFGTGAEVSTGPPYNSETLWHQCRSVSDISASIILRTQKCHINLFV